MFFIFVGCDVKEANPFNPQEEQNPVKEDLGTVEKKTVEELVLNFNTEIYNRSGLGPVDTENFQLKEEEYWYPITEGIFLVVIPDEKAKSPSENFVESMRIYYDKQGGDDPQIPAYARLLILANREDISFEEAEELVENAKEKVQNTGKGISVQYQETDDFLEYQVNRISSS